MCKTAARWAERPLMGHSSKCSVLIVLEPLASRIHAFPSRSSVTRLPGSTRLPKMTFRRAAK